MMKISLFRFFVNLSLCILLSTLVATKCDLTVDIFHCSNFYVSFGSDKKSVSITCTEVKFNRTEVAETLRDSSWNLNELQKLTIENCSISNEFNSYREIRDVFQKPRIKKLTIQNYDDFYLTKEFFDDVDELKLLIFKSIRGIFSLSSDFFASMKNLTELEFIDTDVSNLPARIFGNLSNLHELNLWNLRNISSDFFTGFTNLKTLDITSYPQILHQGDFNHLINLEVLKIQGKGFEHLPEGLLHSNKKLKHVKIRKTKIRKLPMGFLANLTELQKVEIISTELEEIHESIFDGSDNLKKLDLSSNKLIEIPKNLLANKERLKDLNLSKNRLKEFDWHLIYFAINLEKLKISENNISRVESSYEDFSDLNLNSIDLSFNQLKDFSVPKSLRFLESFNISNNYISSASYGVEDLPILKNLKVIDYSRNEFKKLDIIDHMQSLRIALNFSYNQIEYIHIDLNASTPITYIIDNNPLACDCENLSLLKFFKQSYGKLVFENADNLQCSSPDEFHGTKLVDTVFSELSSIPEICPENCTCRYKCINKILILNCSNSQFDQFPIFKKAPADNEASIEIYIENNKITSLPNRTWLERYNVTKIFAANNSITELKDQLPRNLKVLHLDHNKLRNININALSGNLRDVRISHNPLNCECRAFDITRFYNIFSDLQEIECTLNGNNYRLSKLFKDGICKYDTNSNIILGMSVSIFVLTIVIILILYLFLFKYKKDVVVWLYSNNLCLWFLTEEEMDKNMDWDAFISYAHEDEEFATKLVQELETGNPKYKVNIHVRDWLAGAAITEQIVESVNSSHRTIILLSDNYLNSTWGQMEFRMAYRKTLDDKKVRLIIVVCGEIKDMSKVTDELKIYLRTNTYIQWNDPWFIKRLKYALPHKPKGIISDIGPISNGITNNNDVILSSLITTSPP